MLFRSPDPWKPVHSILITRLLAWELNLAWWTDLAYGEIAAEVTPQKLRELYPVYPDSMSVPQSPPSAKSTAHGLHAALEIARSYRGFFGLGPPGAGSNAWVVDSSRSLSGKPLLANDPHLAARGVWHDLDHPRRGKIRVPRSPIRLHGSSGGTVDRRAPLLGEDTDRVLSELLGLDAAELARLHVARVIEPVES